MWLGFHVRRPLACVVALGLGVTALATVLTLHHREPEASGGGSAESGQGRWQYLSNPRAFGDDKWSGLPKELARATEKAYLAGRLYVEAPMTTTPGAPLPGRNPTFFSS